MTSDVVLLDQWRQHADGEAFSLLAHRHASLVADVAFRIAGDRQTAEDALQEALLALANDQSDRPANVGIRAWLHDPRFLRQRTSARHRDRGDGENV